MPAIQYVLFAALLAAAPILQPACAQSAIAPKTASATREDRRIAPPHFDVVNASHDSVEGIAIAPAGSGAFETIDIGDPLRGGVTSITLDVPAGGCLRDVRVTFRQGRALLYPAIDLCRARGMRLTASDSRHTAAPVELAARAPDAQD